MQEQKTSLDVYVQRLDVLCSVIEQVLQPGGRPSKGDLRNLHRAAQKVVVAYLEDLREKGNQNAESTG